MALLEIRDLRKSYPSPTGGAQVVLDIPALSLAEGEQVALAGASGSGKTTLLHVIAGILRPDSGTVLLDGDDVATLPEAKRDALRAAKIGCVYQTFNLLQGHSALENVLLGMTFGPGPDRGRARALLERLGLGERVDHRPHQLSVGQQQRVALARALASRPRLVLADEPTGSLDPEQAAEALALLRETCAESGAALLLVTHDPAVLATFDRVVRLDEIHRSAKERQRTGGGT